MKNWFAAAFFIIVLSGSGALYAEEHRVLALDIVKIPDDIKNMNVALEGIVKEEISVADAYSYVSPDETMRRWFPEESDKEASMKFVALAAVGHTEMGLPVVYAKQRAFRVESLMMYGVERSGGKYAVRSMIVNMDNGRYCTATDEVLAQEIKDTLRRQVRHLLDNGMDLQKVEADKELDALGSLVMYGLKTEDAGAVQVRIKYNPIRTEPEIEDVAIMPIDAKEGERKTLRLKTRENRWIDFSGVVKSGRLNDIITVAEPPDNLTEGAFQEVLTVSSGSGYVLNLTLHWKNKALKALRIDPLVNPYREIS